MRIYDAVSRKRQNISRSLYRYFIRKRSRIFSDEQLRPRHTYHDTITGEHVTVETIGRQVTVSRSDIDETWSTKKENLQYALDIGVLVHDKRHCEACPNI